MPRSLRAEWDGRAYSKPRAPAPGTMPPMGDLDRDLLVGLCDLLGRGEGLRQAMRAVVFNDLLKGAVSVAVVCQVWWRAGDPDQVRRTRASLLASLGATLIALAGNRALATALPFRARPLADPELPIAALSSDVHARLQDLSAFPSDHAVLFFGLTAAVWRVRRGAGAFLLAHTLIVVLLPRLYLGLHWPSDLLAGAVIATLAVTIANRPRLRDPVTRPLLTWSERAPGSFHALLFVCLFCLATLFEGLVQLGYALLEIWGHSGRL